MLIKSSLTVLFAMLALTSQVSAQEYKVIVSGGYVDQYFTSCSAVSCGPGSYCCSFSNQYKSSTVNYFCMNDFQTKGETVGIYQDEQNYPFERFEWNCGNRQQSNAAWTNNGIGLFGSDGYIPVELINNRFWQWAWLIVFTFVVSGAAWFLGYLVYIPFTILIGVYNFAVSIYSTGILIFENPQRLQFQEWLFYPIRRMIVQAFIMTIGSIWVAIPGASAFVLPCLGLWMLLDFLDYQGFDQVGQTLGIPFYGTPGEQNSQGYRDPYYQYSDSQPIY